MKKSLMPVVFLIAIVSSTALADDNFRWDTELVGIGDTTYRVLTACGVPDYREIRVTEKVGGRRGHTWRTKTVTVKGGHKYEGVSSGDELWYYDLGPSQFIYQIEFSKSKVNAIRKQGTGTTEGIADWRERKHRAR